MDDIDIYRANWCYTGGGNSDISDIVNFGWYNNLETYKGEGRRQEELRDVFLDV